jgi:hypothetical protein
MQAIAAVFLVSVLQYICMRRQLNKLIKVHRIETVAAAANQVQIEQTPGVDPIIAQRNSIVLGIKYQLDQYMKQYNADFVVQDLV